MNGAPFRNTNRAVGLFDRIVTRVVFGTLFIGAYTLKTVTHWALQYIVGKRPAGVDDGDLPWRDIPGHVYADEGDAWAAVDELDAAFDHRYTHRAKAIEVDVMAPPLRKSAATPGPAPVNRQLREHRAEEGFRRNIARIEEGLRLGRSRDELLLLVELCGAFLGDITGTLQRQRWQQRLDDLRGQVDHISHLRLVK